MRFLLSVLFLLTITITAIAQEKNYLEPGAIWVYEVDYFGDQYLFILTISESNDGDFSYKWMMSEKLIQGVVNVTREAVNSAMKLHNFLSPGEVTLTDMTSGFLSKKMETALNNGETVKIDMQNEFAEFKKDDGPEYIYSVTVDSKYGNVEILDAYSISDSKKNYQMLILSGSKIPIILEMNVGWTMKLAAIL